MLVGKVGVGMLFCIYYGHHTCKRTEKPCYYNVGGQECACLVSIVRVSENNVAGIFLRAVNRML